MYPRTPHSLEDESGRKYSERKEMVAEVRRGRREGKQHPCVERRSDEEMGGASRGYRGGRGMLLLREEEGRGRKGPEDRAGEVGEEGLERDKADVVGFDSVVGLQKVDAAFFF